MQHKSKLTLRVLIGVGLLLNALAVSAQDEPRVLIDATVRPPANDGTMSYDDALRSKQEGSAAAEAAEAGSTQDGLTQEGSTAADKTSPSPIRPLPVDGTKALPVCDRIQVRAMGNLLFFDSFETGDVSAWRTGETTFSSERTPDLFFDVIFDGTLVGDHVLHLKLTTPRGHHYQTLSAPISSQTTAVGGQRQLESYPHPVDVVVLQPLGAGNSAASSRATLHLPVAGTSIATHGLYGTWLVEAFVDQELTACGEAKVFELQP